MYVHATNTPRGWLYKAYLDGEQIHGCVEANEEEGWARCYEMEDAIGSDPLCPRTLKLRDNKPIESIRRGKIVIVPPDKH